MDVIAACPNISLDAWTPEQVFKKIEVTHGRHRGLFKNKP